MGQGSSRPRNRHATAHPSDIAPISPNPRHTKRKPSAVRRSILNLVKPHSRSANTDNNDSTSSRRRSWFGAKPTRPLSTSQRARPVSLSDADIPSSPSTQSSPPISTPPTPATPSSYHAMDKVPVVEVSSPSLEAQGESSGVDVLPPPRNLSRHPSRLESTEHTESIPEEPLSSASTPAEETVRPTSSHPLSSSQDLDPHPPSSSYTPNHQTLNPQSTPPSRQFPPPGTLVLVQGVVQTTDVPRSIHTDNVHDTSPSPNTADPGSSLGERLSSFISSRPSTASTQPSPSDVAEGFEQHVHEPVSRRSETEGNERISEESPATPPNGVEVLGTLLSVAAAATAASLLAGSTEHILSPSRSNSSSPRTGEVPDLSLHARRERMRHAWQSVRERLGLRPSASASNSTSPASDGHQTDAREVMLTEMARAFNLGLGISPDSEESTPSPSEPEQRPPTPSSPAPGSFERFLADLQSDLRGVLSDGEVPASEHVPESPAETSSTASEGVTEEEASSAESTRESVPETGSRNVNWWRMYRFPPMNAQNRAAVPSDTAPHSHADITSPLSPTDNTDSASSSSNNVVPIVVVGLRSVNTPGQTVSPEPTTRAAGATPDEADPMPGSWPSRAADALRHLRPARGEPAEAAQASTGSPRTFLIFVIGGYYPPDHSMVTGGENSLASFEALLELAEMLGQAKPQTASKDDIERSGLEIIKASELAKYEQQGKISSNCTDRCLICLDDYDPEDPVRLMKCRHGFHKSCVDRWLETGRNNCPACRSAGVTTDINAV